MSVRTPAYPEAFDAPPAAPLHVADRVLADSPPRLTVFGLEPLTPAQKLETLWDDARTRFVPSHNDEKSEALNILAFLSDPEQHPGGIHDHLAEVFQKHKSDAGKRGESLAFGAIKGSLAVQSILFTYADNFNSAEQGHHNLSLLEAAIDDCVNPNLSLAQYVTDDHDSDMTGVAELVRFIDILQPHIPGIALSQPGFSPPRTKITRFASPQNGKNKLVRDHYTAEQPEPAVIEHIQTVAAELTTGSLRQLLPRVRSVEYNRAIFWSRVLRARYYEYQDKADKALQTTSLSAV